MPISQAPKTDPQAEAGRSKLALVGISSGMICAVLVGLLLVATVVNIIWCLTQSRPFCAYWDYGIGLTLASILVGLVCVGGIFLSVIAFGKHKCRLSRKGMLLSLGSLTALAAFWVFDFGILVYSSLVCYGV